MAAAPAKPGRKITGRQAAIGLGLAGLLIVGYVIYRRRQAAAATAASTTPVPGGDIGAGGTYPFPTGVGVGPGGGVTSPPPPTDGGGGTPPPPTGGGGGGGTSTITVWVHGNPGHPESVTITGTGPQWVNVGGQWLYVVPGQITGSAGNTWDGQAYTQGDAPPGAGSPPSSTSPASTSTAAASPAAASLPNGTVGQLATYMPAGIFGAFTPNTQTSRWAAASQLSSPQVTFPIVGQQTGGTFQQGG